MAAQAEDMLAGTIESSCVVRMYVCVCVCVCVCACVCVSAHVGEREKRGEKG